MHFSADEKHFEKYDSLAYKKENTLVCVKLNSFDMICCRPKSPINMNTTDLGGNKSVVDVKSSPRPISRTSMAQGSDTVNSPTRSKCLHSTRALTPIEIGSRISR